VGEWWNEDDQGGGGVVAVDVVKAVAVVSQNEKKYVKNVEKGTQLTSQ
jgi:hypothetical protein